MCVGQSIFEFETSLERHGAKRTSEGRNLPLLFERGEREQLELLRELKPSPSTTEAEFRSWIG